MTPPPQAGAPLTQVPFPLSELHAALLQATITLGLVSVCVLLYVRFQKPHFFWWAVAWTLYLTRLGAILIYVQTTRPFWLYAHQVATGWTALALLGAAVSFAQLRRLDSRWLVPA